MKSIWLLFKKEQLEAFRNYQWIILSIAFIFIGILNPFTALITPTLMENLLPVDIASTFPEPTAVDAWAQFYKNTPQLGLVLMLLMFSSKMGKELREGTLTIFITKGVRREAFFFSKWGSALFTWTVVLLLTFMITWGYTAFYFDQSIVDHLVIGAFPFYVFGCLLLTIAMTIDTILPQSFAGLAGAGVFFIGFLVLQLIPENDWNPLLLVQQNIAYLTGEVNFSVFTVPLIVSFLCMIGMIGLALVQLKRTEL